MRVHAKVRESHHKSVIKAAARQLRLKGVAGLSIAAVMQGEGLTHGGFYRHFKSKDALIEAALGEMFAPFIAALTADQASLGPHVAVRRYVDRYLSLEHVHHPEWGCPVAAFANEMRQLKPAARAAFAAGLVALKEALVPGLQPASRRTADALLALLAGAVVLARTATDDVDAVTTLQAARHHAQGFLG